MKSIELFAGAGGLAFGTAEAGFHHKIVVERNANACATLRRNHDAGVRHVRDWEIVEKDVTRCDFTPYRDDIDFVCGGPPCQPFSLGGKHGGHQDDRNMFPQAVRAVREVRPMAFLFENVRGLLRKSFANYYSYIIHQLRFPTVTPQGDEDWTDHLARLERLYTSEPQGTFRRTEHDSCRPIISQRAPALWARAQVELPEVGDIRRGRANSGWALIVSPTWQPREPFIFEDPRDGNRTEWVSLVVRVMADVVDGEVLLPHGDDAVAEGIGLGCGLGSFGGCAEETAKRG